MKQCGIYLITNKKDKKYYVGSSNNIYYRWTTHRRKLNINQHPNIHLQRAWNKNGGSQFTFSISRLAPERSLLSVEQEYLNKCTPETSYNFNLTASKPPSPKGRVWSVASRKKLSKKKKGVSTGPHPEEVKRKISAALLGKKKSKEHARKIGLARKGFVVTDITRKKLSLAREDKTIYTITHISGKTFVGTRREMRKKIGMTKSQVNNLFGKYQRAVGWRLPQQKRTLAPEPQGQGS